MNDKLTPTQRVEQDAERNRVSYGRIVVTKPLALQLATEVEAAQETNRNNVANWELQCNDLRQQLAATRKVADELASSIIDEQKYPGRNCGLQSALDAYNNLTKGTTK